MVAGEQHVLRFNVPMDDASRVRVVECVGDLTRDADRLVEWEGAESIEALPE